MVTASAPVAKRVESQLKAVIRPLYSSPPMHGAAIAATVLGDPALFAEWRRELAGMADRIKDMRKGLHSALNQVHTAHGVFVEAAVRMQPANFMSSAARRICWCSHLMHGLSYVCHMIDISCPWL